MGYYTYHDIDVRGLESESRLEELKKYMEEKEIINYAVCDDATLEHPHFSCRDAVKWYEETTDMIDVSLKFPELTFMVFGDGEESDDFYKNYYKNGAHENCRAELTYPEPVTIRWRD